MMGDIGEDLRKIEQRLADKYAIHTQKILYIDAGNREWLSSVLVNALDQRNKDNGVVGFLQGTPMKKIVKPGEVADKENKGREKGRSPNIIFSV